LWDPFFVRRNWRLWVWRKVDETTFFMRPGSCRSSCRMRWAPEIFLVVPVAPVCVCMCISNEYGRGSRSYSTVIIIYWLVLSCEQRERGFWKFWWGGGVCFSFGSFLITLHTCPRWYCALLGSWREIFLDFLITWWWWWSPMDQPVDLGRPDRISWPPKTLESAPLGGLYVDQVLNWNERERETLLLLLCISSLGFFKCPIGFGSVNKYWDMAATPLDGKTSVKQTPLLCVWG
jgi:hypothetical protein